MLAVDPIRHRMPVNMTKTMNKNMILPVALILFFSGYAGADELADAAQGLCDSVKTCALEQIAEEDMTPELRQMMVPMMENMCASMRSMESLSCDQLQNPDRGVTPECAEYERLAKEAG